MYNVYIILKLFNLNCFTCSSSIVFKLFILKCADVLFYEKLLGLFKKCNN